MNQRRFFQRGHRAIPAFRLHHGQIVPLVALLLPADAGGGRHVSNRAAFRHACGKNALADVLVGNQVNFGCGQEVRAEARHASNAEIAVDVVGNLSESRVDGFLFAQIRMQIGCNALYLDLSPVQGVDLCAQIHQHLRRGLTHTAGRASYHTYLTRIPKVILHLHFLLKKCQSLHRNSVPAPG